jgi:hypothetical protein
MLIEESGLSSTVIIAKKKEQKNVLISTRASVTSAEINATAVIAQRYCLLLNILGGKAALLGLLNEAGEVKSTKSGNERYLRETGDAYGVALLKSWKQTILSGGVNTQNSDMKSLMDELSV